MSASTFDLVVVGGGIVGASTAWQFQRRYPQSKVLLLEKEPAAARHQTGRNSGVIHAGVYYAPGSLKARFCREGSSATYRFCEDHGLAARRTGKLIVATDPAETEALDGLFERCEQNGLQPEKLSGDDIRRLEPMVTGVAAIRVGQSGITDYAAICREMLNRFTDAGGTVRFGAHATGLSETGQSFEVSTPDEPFSAGYGVVCAGLQADRLARLQGLDPDFRVIPVRGEYYRLGERVAGLVRHLVYPVPDPALPFLGIHLTPMIDGALTVGPNAVLGWMREAYDSNRLCRRDLVEIASYAGFWAFLRKNFRHGVAEWRDSVWKRGYLKRVRKYCPRIRRDDLHPHPTGIRAQLVRADGSLIDDFLFLHGRRSLHVCNAPSPAATSAIPIGSHIVEEMGARIGQ